MLNEARRKKNIVKLLKFSTKILLLNSNSLYNYYIGTIVKLYYSKKLLK